MMDTHRDRDRSRSPYHRSHRHHQSSRHARSRSARKDDRHRHKRHRSRSPPARPVKLPYSAQALSKRDLENYRQLFASYLDIQKQIHLEDLEERELKGRWKRFIERWNRGDLPEGWYDPVTLKKAKESAATQRNISPPPKKRGSPEREPYAGNTAGQAEADSDEDDFGPALPEQLARQSGRAGPVIPRLEDLEYRDELGEEDRARERADYVDDIRYERKADRALQKSRLEELAPRADPGSRERQLEKKRETTSTLNAFRDAKESGEAEVNEADLMGEDSLDGFKKKKMEGERKKNEREVRKEEIMRAREAEREERLRGVREKEAKTMEFLQALARERFGGGGGTQM